MTDIDNKLEELDFPGEWYFDSANKKVYFFAPNGADPNKILVEGMCLDSALGARNCKIENICFSHQWDKAMSVTRTVEVRNCSFVGQRGNAINASFDSENIKIYGNFFDNILNVAFLEHVVILPDFAGNGKLYLVWIFAILFLAKSRRGWYKPDRRNSTHVRQIKPFAHCIDEAAW